MRSVDPELWRTAADQRAYQDARRRVRALRFFYMHALIYVGVNALLIVINLVTSPERPWVRAPLMGWGIGLAVHGIERLPVVTQAAQPQLLGVVSRSDLIKASATLHDEEHERRTLRTLPLVRRQ